jgi:hypothetical protein
MVYPIADTLSLEDWEKLGIPPVDSRHLGYHQVVVENENYRLGAIKIGEKRPPKAGEWYLSGAIPEAYRSKADQFPAFPIVRLVLFQLETLVKIREDYHGL